MVYCGPRLQASDPSAATAPPSERWANVAAAAADAVSSNVAIAKARAADAASALGSGTSEADQRASLYLPSSGAVEQFGGERAPVKLRARAVLDSMRTCSPEEGMYKWAAAAVLPEEMGLAIRESLGDQVDLVLSSDPVDALVFPHVRSMEWHLERALARQRGAQGPSAASGGEAGGGSRR